MKSLPYYSRPLSWLVVYLMALLFFGLLYVKSLRQLTPPRITEASSLPPADEKVSISTQGSGLKGLPAYLALDASNRRAIVGSIPMGDFAVDVEIVHGQAYVVSQSKGVSVFDLSVPTRPEINRTIHAAGIGWRSDADENSLYLSSVANGVLIHSLSGRGMGHRILVSALATIHHGKHLFVAEGKSGLSIYEFVREAGIYGESRLLGHLELPGFTRDLTFLGSSLVAASMAGGLHLVDIDDSENPRLLQTIADQEIYENVWVVGDIVYAAAQDRQVDLFRLAEKRLNLVGSLPLVGSVKDFLLDGERLYLAENSFGISVLDVSDPAHPQRTGFVGTPGQSAGLALYGDYLYVASSTQGVQIVDTKLIEPLNVLASVDTPGIALDLVLDGRWIYVTDGSAGLQVIDRNDVENFKLVATLPTQFRAMSLVKIQNILFISIERQGLIGVDVSQPMMPKLVSRLNVGENLSDLAVRGSTLFASSFDGKLLKIDISDPVHPWVAESIELPGKPRRIALQGDDVFIAVEKAGLLVVRFTPGQPGRMIGGLTRPWPMNDFSAALGVAVRGRYAYLLQGEEGLEIVDISQPENPRTVNFIPLPDWGLSIRLTKTFAVVTTRWSGFFFIDISRPERPHLAANLYLPRSDGNFEIEGNRIYATGKMNGINVVPLPVKNIGASNSSKLSLFFEKPQFPGWYDLSVSGGKTFVTAPSVLRVD